MAKLALTNLVNLQNENTAVSAINANNAALVAAVDKALFRDGTSPNQMTSDLDMNSNSIINLPEATLPTEPVRLGEMENFVDILQDAVDHLNLQTGTQTTNTQFNSRASVAATNISSSLSFLRTAGYTTAGDKGGGLYIRRGVVNPSHAGKVQSLDGAWWELDVPGVYNVRQFGAVGDGSTDDTVAIQNTINAAQVTGAAVYIPTGIYKTTTFLTVTNRITIYGDGCQDDSGGGYQGVGLNPSPLSVLRGTIILPGTHDCFRITTNYAVKMYNLQISYSLSASSGTGAIGIKLDSVAGAGNSNTRSIFRDVTITRADYSMQLTNCLEFHIDNVNMLYHWVGGLICTNPNYPHYSDATIENCTFWGGAITNAFHINLKSGGGYRILNNKFNSGGAGISSAILVEPTLSVSQNMEPLMIVGNSIEGQTNGITFNNGNALASVLQVVIVGNQIWAGNNAIIVNDNFGQAWVSGITITGNTLTVNGGGVLIPICQFSGMSYGSITGNLFGLAFGGTGVAIGYGTNVFNVKQSNNSAINGIILHNNSTPAVPPSTNGIYNLTPWTMEVQITGGTGTLVQINSVTQQSQSAGPIRYCGHLEQGDHIEITYTVAPTWSWRPINP